MVSFCTNRARSSRTWKQRTRPLPLVPADARGRARVDMHMKLCDLQMSRPTGTIVFPKRFLPRERWDGKAMAQAKSDIEKHLEIVERQLGHSDYLVADRFTLADLAYTPVSGISAPHGDCAAACGGRLARSLARAPQCAANAADPVDAMAVPVRRGRSRKVASRARAGVGRGCVRAAR